MDLLSLVLTLRPTAAGTPPPRLARAAHAILLQRIAAQDPQLATLLHDEEGPKPLTCSDLLGPRRNGAISPEQTYTLRYTALIAPVAEALANAFTPGETLTFEGVDFSVLDCAPTPAAPSPSAPRPGDLSDAGNPWIGAEEYQTLAARHLLPGEQEARRRWEFLIAAPLAFQTRGKTQPLPLPELFFGSLALRWNAFAPVALPEEGIRRYAEELIAVSRFELRSAPGWERGPGLRIGAIGRITYQALNRDRYWLAVFSLLAEFALYAGVGAMTTAGMGQVRQIAQGE